MTTFLLAPIPLQDFFMDFRQGFAVVLMYIFGFVLLVSLVTTAVAAFKGDRESIHKMLKWIIVGAVGMILISVLANLNIAE